MLVDRQGGVQHDPNAHLFRVAAGILAFAIVMALVGASGAWTFAHRNRIPPQEIATIATADNPAKATAVAPPKAKFSPEEANVAGTPESAGAKTTPHTTKPAKAEAGEARVLGGLFAVQLGVAGSKAEARDIMRKVASKYGSQIGGRRLGYHHVKDGNKSVYRVDVGGMSKEAAAAICKQVKSAGGNCFVTGN
jgi:cell division septation protein DedD